MSVLETITSSERAADMEEGQAVLGAPQNGDPDTVQEKSADDEILEVAQGDLATAKGNNQARQKFIDAVRSKKFEEYQKHVRQQHEQWSKAIDHVKEYLKNKELTKTQHLQSKEDPPSPSKPLPKHDTGFSQEHAEPRQLPGYPELAEFLGSDERWLMSRRFGTLQARLVLEKQDQIREIQEELEAYDQADYSRAEDDDMQNFRLFTRRRLNPEERKLRQELMDRAAKEFKEYAELVNAIHSMACFEKPATFEYKTVVDYVEKTAPTRPSEMEWIYQRDDIVTLRGPRENAIFGAYLETFVNRLSAKFPSLQKIFRPPTWLDGNRMAERLSDWAIMGFLILLIPVMFVVPIYALYKVGDDITKSIGILLSFALIFMVVLQNGTTAKPHEVLSGSAAYLAVLVVFFGSVNPGIGNSSGSSSSNGNAT